MDFARIYDLIQSNIDLESLLTPIIPYLNVNDVVIDAGCGTGHILTFLAKRGFHMIGLDYDESMLSLAKDKVDSNHLDAKLFLHDLRKPLGIKVSQIISLLDVSHYFMGVKKVFKNYYDALYDGGTLILDLYKEPIQSTESDDDPIDYVWEVQTKNTLIKHKLTVNIDGVSKTFEVKEYYYPLEYYLSTLKSLGFKVEIIPSFDDRKVNVICKK
jgi:cyclopropane fatty-acyl-phospholipid synthase-like methyltransferase